VTIVEDRLKPKPRILIQIGLSVAAVVFLSVVALTGRVVMDSMLNMTLLSIPGIPMSIMYASVPAGSILMIFYLIRRIAADCRGLRNLHPKGR
jgi:TRAP-type C4-dicarboxylate transport system permease small subunit